MKLLTSDEKLLMEEALEALHQQSTGWLHQLDLWKDEKIFYHDLITNKLLETSLPDKQLVALLLDKAEGEQLDALYKDIQAHEKFLWAAMKATDKEDRCYRDKHTMLLERFNELNAKVTVIRKEILGVMKIVNENFFNHNETLKIIEDRRAVRKYKDQPVDHMQIELLLKAACMAPSAINGQPWKFYIVTDKAKIKKYDAETFKAADRQFHNLLVHMQNEEQPIFHGAPVVIFITSPRSNEWAGLDTGFCAQNLMLAAKSMGLDSCPVGLACFIEKTPVYNELCIPLAERVMIAIVLGYGAEKPVMHQRKTHNVFFLT